MDSNPPLPLEFKLLGYQPSKFNETDILAMMKLMSNGMSMNVNQEMVRLKLRLAGKSLDRINALMPEYPSNSPVIVTSKDFDWDRNLRPPSAAAAADEQKRQQHKESQEIPMPHNNNNNERPEHSEREETASFRFMKKILPRSPRASNNWVLSGSKTVTGKCQEYSLFIIFYI